MEIITVRSFPSDGRWYRAWETPCIYRSDAGLVTLGGPPTVVYKADGTTYRDPHRIRACYWFDRPYNLLEVFDEPGNLVELYIHIASPARLVGDELHFTDYELDVVVPAGGSATIVDQDEFTLAVDRYGYSPEFIVSCEVACRRALALLDRWVINAPPMVALNTQD